MKHYALIGAVLGAFGATMLPPASFWVLAPLVGAMLGAVLGAGVWLIGAFIRWVRMWDSLP